MAAPQKAPAAPAGSATAAPAWTPQAHQNQMQIGQLMANNGQLQQSNGQLLMENANLKSQIEGLKGELSEAKGETPPPDGGKTNRQTRRATGAKRRQAKKVETAANGAAGAAAE